MYSNNQDDLLGSSNDKDKHHTRIRIMGTQKYLRKNCYHRIKCTATNFLAAFMWRRPLNSTTLAATTHKRPERVSDGTNTQVVAQTIKKWRIKIVQKELYNVRDPPWIGDQKNHKRNTVAIKNQLYNQICRDYIRIDLLGLCRGQLSLI